MRITILGAGAWGTALARLLHQGGHQVTLWGHIAEWLDEIRQTGRNDRFLPGIEVPRDLILEGDLPRAIATAECIVVAVPSQPFRQVTRHLAGYSGLIASVTKGIEYDTGLTMCGILAENAPRAKCAALSGPTFAIEVARASVVPPDHKDLRIRGMHPSGKHELLVENMTQLVAAKDVLIRIAGGVGGKLKAKLVAKAAEMNLRVLNP